MSRISIADAKPGQIIEHDIFSPKGQLIAKGGATLNGQLILHMKFYNIHTLDIVDGEMTEEQADEFVKDTLIYRIKHSQEFQAFKANYDNQVENISSVLSDFVQRQVPLNEHELVNDTKKLFAENATGITMMNMLLSMREIDDLTYAHSVNVAITSRVLGGWLGFSEEDLDVLTLAGLLHDVGKCAVPNNILQKPASLTTEEYEVMKKHPVLGYDLLYTEDIDMRIKLAALQHHERCDGSGYPYGTKQSQLEPFSMIVSIADVYDAMTADRVYRDGICPFDVIAEFQQNSFTLFHPQYIMIFLSRIADSYVNAGVILSDGSRGKILMTNSNALTRPLVQLDSGVFIDLRDRTDLYIKSII